MKPIKLQNGLWAVSVPAYEKGYRQLAFEEILDGQYEILGTVDKDTISFDVAEYCDINRGNIANTIHFREMLSSHGITDYEKIIILKEI